MCKGGTVTEQIIWKEEKKNIGSLHRVLKGILTGIAYLLLAHGVMNIAAHLFGIQNVAGSGRYGGILLISTLGVALWNESLLCKANRRKQLLGNGLLLLGLALLLYMAYRGTGDELWEGLQRLGDAYMARWEAHSAKFVPVNTGNVSAMRVAAELVLLIIIPLLQMAGAMVRRHKWALVLPIVILCAGLWVVYNPRWKDLIFLCISGGLFFYLDSSEEIQGKRLLGVTAVLCILASIPSFFQEKAESWVIERNVDWFSFQENLEARIQSGDFVTGFSQKDLVDNRAPRFKYEEVIQLTMSGNPQKNVYLRGYHCKDYENGVWEKSDDAFQAACKEQGIKEEDASRLLLSALYQSEDLPENESLLYKLNYTGLRDKYTYLPYGAGWETDPEGYDFSGDTVVGKARGRKEAEALGRKDLRYLDESPILGVFSAENDAELSDMQLESFFSSEYESEMQWKSIFTSGYDPEKLSQEEKQLFEWYTDFVYENYLYVPENMKNVKDIAGKIENSVSFHYTLQFLELGENDIITRNSVRLEIAYMVASILTENGIYSWDLDTLPKGEDAVEYFVGTSTKGYCTHFASAGTLLLRELGIPARYVVGYVVKPGQISYSEGGYSASVLDSDAHAWTEIYLDNYGWVPVEMTPGYQDVRNPGNQNLVLTPVEGAETSEPTEEEHAEEEDLPEEKPSTPEEEPPQESKEELPAENIENEVTREEEGADSGSGKGLGEDGVSGSKLPVLFIPALLLLAAVGFVWYRYLTGRRGRGERRLNGYLRREDHKRAVIRMHSGIYKRLVKKERQYSGVRDKELLVALKKEFSEIKEEDWDNYFQVVRRAVYSGERITPQEAAECYRIYEMIHMARSTQAQK